MLFAITIVRNTGELLKGSSGRESSEQRKRIGSLAQERCGTRKEKGVEGESQGSRREERPQSSQTRRHGGKLLLAKDILNPTGTGMVRRN